MDKNFDEFLGYLYSDEIMNKWKSMESDTQSEIQAELGDDDKDNVLIYAGLSQTRWTLFVLKHYHEWINSQTVH